MTISVPIELVACSQLNAAIRDYAKELDNPVPDTALRSALLYKIELWLTRIPEELKR